MKFGLNKIFFSIVTIILLFFIALTLGLWWPPTLTTKPISLPDFSDEYLDTQEAIFPQLKPNVRKRVLWANSNKTQTDVSFVYIHGFSATALEISPVMETLAEKFHANLYFARLEGHGLDGTALGNTSPQKWLEDAIEAFEIGKKSEERSF